MDDSGVVSGFDSGGDLDGELNGIVVSGVAPVVLSTNAQIRFFANPHHPGSSHNQFAGFARVDVHDHVTWDVAEPRRTQRIDIESKFKSGFGKGLNPRAGSTATPVAETQNNMITWLQVAVYRIYDNRFLERAFMAMESSISTGLNRSPKKTSPA